MFFITLFNIIRKSITYKLVVAFILLVITPMLIIGYISYKSSEDIIINKVSTSTLNTLEKTSNNLKSLFDSMIYVSNTINLNKNVQQILMSNKKDDITDYWKNVQEVDNIFLSINSTFFPYHSYFTVIGDNGVIFSSWNREPNDIKRLADQEWYKRIESNEFLWIPAHENYASGEKEQFRTVFTLARKIQEGIARKSYGICIVSLPHSEIANILGKSSSFAGSILAVYGDKDEPFIQVPASTESNLAEFKSLHDLDGIQGSFVKTVNNRKYLVNYHEISVNNWWVVEAIPYDSLLGETQKLKEKIIFFLVVEVFLFVVISSITALSITKPIRLLNNSMKEIQRGNLSVKLEVQSIDEIASLVDTFNAMVQKIKSLIEELFKEQEKERELEIQALQAQIKPHFLFNTLNSIRWVAVMSQADSVSDMIGALSSLLKMSINSTDKFITIREELENVKNYLFIQKVRYNSRFDTVFEVDEELLELKTLKLILQPIVENCLLHGFDKTNSESIIKINGRKNENNVILRVQDNGIGMDAEKLEQLLKKLGEQERVSGGIGVRNVHQRLALNFGEGYGLNIVSDIKKGTTVELKFPVLE